MGKDAFLKAVYYYQMAMNIDPGYAQAYFGILQCYGMMASWELFPKEERFKLAQEALEAGAAINNSLPEYHFSLNYQSLWRYWKYKETYKHIKNALKLAPNNAEYLESAAELYISQGAFGEAAKLIRLALEYNPLSANHYFTKGNILYLSKDYHGAIEQFDKSLEIDPAWTLSLKTKAFCLILLKEREKLKKYLIGNPHIPNSDDFLGLYDLMYTKKRPASQFPTNEYEYFPWKVYVPLYDGDTDTAVNELTQGVDQRLGQYINFKNDPLLAPLRTHPVFKELHQHFSCELPDAQSLLPQNGTDSSAKMDDEDAREWINSLTELMDAHKPFLKPDLNLKS